MATTSLDITRRIADLVPIAVEKRAELQVVAGRRSAGRPLSG